MSQPRYAIEPIDMSKSFRAYMIRDRREERVIGSVWNLSDAERMVFALNAQHTATNPRLRPVAALEIEDFRLKLEHDNGGPLVEDPQLALFLSDLCDFFGFTSGERAIALGRDLLVLLSRMDCEPAEEPNSSIVDFI